MQTGFGVLSLDIASEMTVCKSRRVTAPECPNIMCNVCPAHTLTTFIYTGMLSGVSSIVRILNPNQTNKYQIFLCVKAHQQVEMLCQLVSQIFS